MMAITAITSITADEVSGDEINLLSVTADGYTVSVDNLRTGTSSGTSTHSNTELFPIINLDNFNITSFSSEWQPHYTHFFGGGLYTGSAAGWDFVIFDNGGNDSGDIQAIFADDSLGQAISFDSGDYGDTGFDSNVGGQNIEGFVFSVGDLLDASGNPLSSTAVIKGLNFNSGGLDGSCLAAVHRAKSSAGGAGCAKNGKGASA